jgi:sialic acid synthase SpsE/spore coat polysaccharide biosynthesis protein SpsF (cytidylyltransferase family)
MKIIAESAYNHMGDVEMVKNLLRASASSRADYFTVQIMNPAAFSEKTYSKHQLYIDHNISFEEWSQVFKLSNELGLPIIPCPLDEDSFDFVMSLGVKLIKIHATDLTNPGMLERISQNEEVRVLLETQAATNFEIRFALSRIDSQVEAILTGYSNYPTEYEDLNLDSLDAISAEYGHKIGFADHSLTTTEVPLMCLAKGCAYFEKHITLTRNNRNFDYQVSLYPEEFQVMVSKVKLFSKALGNGVKHPVQNEKPHRNILYKKVLEDGSIKRSDHAPEFVRHRFNSFSKNQVAVAVIARLKSQRLPKKVMRDLGDETLIQALYNNISQSKFCTSIHLATSNLSEDDPLAHHAASLDIPVFRGHPQSVIDRMLDLAWSTKSGVIIRVTGDNPFTNPELLDKTIALLQENNLDYAKVNNAPFGMSAEVFSSSYLWDLYIRMENPMVSEYLTWFVLLDDQAKKGSIDLKVSEGDLSFKNLSIDYPKDLEYCQRILQKAGKSKVSEVSAQNLLEIIEKELPDVEDGLMKLPQGKRMKLSAYIQSWKDLTYTIREDFSFSD